jgi:hypothetical protein
MYMIPACIQPGRRRRFLMLDFRTRVLDTVQLANLRNLLRTKFSIQPGRRRQFYNFYNVKWNIVDSREIIKNLL